MKTVYLDIMEKALSAYDDTRIREYINDVRANGLTEHGFPRLAVNIGILIAYERRVDLLNTFIEMMDICCEQIPISKEAGNNFSIREVCCCLMLLEGSQKISSAHITKWKQQLMCFDPWKFYQYLAPSPDVPVGNWALFAAVSDFVRGEYLGVDTSGFVEWQLSSQMLCFDEYDMYKDPENPIVYDMVPRILLAFLLRFGYRGKYAERIQHILDNTAEITLKMQSVTGELAFGGRSNQFLHTEPMISTYCEMEAARYAAKGDTRKAGEFKAAAMLAAQKTLQYLSLSPISHVKNRYPLSTRIGCEEYGYFNKYMITVASNIYMGFLFADDSIAPTKAVAETGGYVISTGEEFHQTFLNAGDYCLQIDTCANFHYDANGLGRVHKKDCPSPLCLSVPFSPHPRYVLEADNRSAMSLCCFAETDGKTLLGAESNARYTLVSSRADSQTAVAVFDCRLSEDITITQQYTVSKDGVDIVLSGAEDVGFMLPVFDFDGEKSTAVSVDVGSITVLYNDAVCTYTFDGAVDGYELFYNRNGRYRVYKVATEKVHISIEKE